MIPAQPSRTAWRVAIRRAAHQLLDRPPWRTSFDADELTRELRALGFAVAQPFSSDAINARYFTGRADGLVVGGMGQLMWAGASPPA